MPKTTNRGVWNLTIRGKNKAAVITTIDKDLVSDFKKSAEVLYERGKIPACTPYACSSYFVKLGIAATIATIKE